MDVARRVLNRVAGRWAFGATLTLIMAIMMVLAVWVHIHEVSVDFALLREPKNRMEGKSPLQHHDVDADRQTNGPVSPDLRTCNASVRRNGSCVNCCPPKTLPEEHSIDFQFPDPSSPLRLRPAAHLVDEYYIAKYREAVSRMKSLPYDDPRNFFRQADLHCAYCTSAYKQKNSNIPLNVHKSWLFFPWHRMMLYFHERILGNLIEDDCFALPFWNWDNPDGMVIPEMYMSGPLNDPNRDRCHLPPHVVDLDFNLSETKREPEPEEQKKTNLALMYLQMVSAAKTADLFMGCSHGSENHCSGPIERIPHNTVHDWTGSPLNPQREDMGVLYSAGRDPIFYGHHGNIDRLWEVWRGLPGHENSEINDTDWLDSYFFFHDERRQLVRIKIRDVVNITKLRYAYQEVDLPWLNNSSKDARDRLKMRNLDGKNLQVPSSPILSADFRPHGRTLDTTITVKVDRPPKHRSKKQKDLKEEEVMVVYGIEIKEDIYVKFDVFVSAVNETSMVAPKSNAVNETSMVARELNAVNETSMVAPELIEFAGTFVSLPHGVWSVMRKKSNLKLGISELLQDLKADEHEIIGVTMVPRVNCMKVTVDGIRIE